MKNKRIYGNKNMPTEKHRKEEPNPTLTSGECGYRTRECAVHLAPKCFFKTFG